MYSFAPNDGKTLSHQPDSAENSFSSTRFSNSKPRCLVLYQGFNSIQGLEGGVDDKASCNKMSIGIHNNFLNRTNPVSFIFILLKI